MAYFHLMLQPPRPSFPGDANAEEMAAMAEHAGYWRAHAEDGKAIAVGPVFAEGHTFGIAIVDVDGHEEAQMLADNDPAIKAGLGFRFIISPMPSIILRQAAATAEAKS